MRWIEESLTEPFLKLAFCFLVNWNCRPNKTLKNSDSGTLVYTEKNIVKMLKKMIFLKMKTDKICIVKVWDLTCIP